MNERILILTPGGLEDGGGIGRQMGYLSDAWAKLRGAPKIQIIDSHGAGSRIWSPFFLVRSLISVAAEKWSHQIVLIHVNIAGRGSTLRKLIAVPTLNLLGIPVVLHLHDYNYPRYIASLPVWLQRAVAAMFQSAAKVIVLGEADATFVHQELGVRRDRVTVMHNAVPRPATITEPGDAQLLQQPFQILFLGGLSERKGVPELIEALASPALRALPWRAILAGGGPVEHYRAEVEKAGLADRVALPGWVDRDTASNLLAQSTMLVLPSHDEGMPISVLEALSHGLPIVCTKVGALNEVIIDGASGLFVPVNDPATLAATMGRVLADPALRSRLSAGARKRFAAGFDVARYAERMLALYQAVNAAGGRRLGRKFEASRS